MQIEPSIQKENQTNLKTVKADSLLGLVVEKQKLIGKNILNTRAMIIHNNH